MTIKLYGTLGCPSCLMAKKYLDANEIEYKYMVIGQDIKIEDYIEKFNVSGVPLLVNGKNQVLGFVPEDYDKIL